MLNLTTMCPLYSHVMMMSSTTVISWGTINCYHVSYPRREKGSLGPCFFKQFLCNSLLPATLGAFKRIQFIRRYEILKFQSFVWFKIWPTSNIQLALIFSLVLILDLLRYSTYSDIQCALIFHLLQYWECSIIRPGSDIQPALIF